MENQDFRNGTQSHHAIESYEFTYFPSFHRSFEAALWKDQDNQLYVSLKLNPPHYSPTRAGGQVLGKEVQKPLDPPVWDLLQEALDRYAFWGEASWGTEVGHDGAFWYFTGLRNGISRFRESWSPDENEPAHGLGWFFFNLVPPGFCPVMTSEQAAEAYRYRPIPNEFPIIIVY